MMVPDTEEETPSPNGHGVGADGAQYDTQPLVQMDVEEDVAEAPQKHHRQHVGHGGSSAYHEGRGGTLGSTCLAVILPMSIRALPTSAVRVLFVEFSERVTYYGVVFSLTTYQTVLMRISSENSDAIVNAIYAVAPLTSIIGAHFADVTWGRPKTLAVFGSIFTFGVWIVFLSGIPAIWDDFPRHPSDTARILLFMGEFIVAGGYGGLKICTSPLMAESLDPNLPDHDALVSSLMRWIFWTINLGGTVGMIAGPYLRKATRPTIHLFTGNEAATGYWASFLFCALVATSAMLLFAHGYKSYVRRPRTTHGPLHVFLYATVAARNYLRRDKSLPAKPTWMHHVLDTEEHLDEEFARDMHQTLQACKVFIILPWYWTLSNMFSTNVFLQSLWMERPGDVPPEVFNNISTIALLTMIPLCDRVIFPRLYPHRPPPFVGRMVFGMMIIIVSICWCAGLQREILKRGVIIDKYLFFPHPGEEALSGMHLVGPYLLSGFASAFVDCSSLEAAFLLAPKKMKSFIMALYLLCAGVSGAIGIGLSPLGSPDTLERLYFAIAGVMFVLAIAFYIAMRHVDEKSCKPKTPPDPDALDHPMLADQ